MLHNRQIQELKQTLKLTPQQMQFMRLLELNTLELEEYVLRELEENPAVEEGVEASTNDETDDLDNATTTDDDSFDYANDYTDDDRDPISPADSSEPSHISPLLFLSNATPSLQEYLLEQLAERDLSEQDQQICHYIIGNLTDDGSLDRTLEALSDDLLFQVGIDVANPALERLLHIVQELDPPGVAARSLQECLSIQLKRMPSSPIQQIALQIIDRQFDAYTHKNFEKIYTALSIDEQTLTEANHLIVSLNPKPGAAWNNDSIAPSAFQITPDFLIEVDQDTITVQLNGSNAPELRINNTYRTLLQESSSKESSRTKREAALYVKQKVDSARWFIDAIRQRQETLRHVMEAIIRIQHAYFLSGDEADLRPMILKDIAERTGYDISTVSRVSNSKYAQTPYGIFLLRHFFADRFLNDEGEEITTREIKRTLADLIQEEDKSNPLRDEDLAHRLSEKGYTIARRTVVKYREQLNIPSSKFRREIQ